MSAVQYIDVLVNKRENLKVDMIFLLMLHRNIKNVIVILRTP